jgi:hypothetical protein
MADGEIQVGDIGTIYQVPIYDEDLAMVNFDPSSALVKKIYFRMPTSTGHVTRERTAVPAQVAIDGVQTWCLTYTVLAADAAEFHTDIGLLTIQGYIEYADGRKWRSNKITKDYQGRPLRIFANI